MSLAKSFFEDIRKLILSARATVTRGVDLVQVYTNFEIGRRIVEQEQEGKDRAAYGEKVIKALADRLTNEFGNGFSERNLAYMRTFYLLYQERIPILQTASAKSLADKKGQTLSAKSNRDKKTTASPGQLTQSLSLAFSPDIRQFSLSWSHYVFLIGIKNPDERNFYEIEASQQNWTLRELKRQFVSSLYERLALSRDKKGIRRLAEEGQMITQPKDAKIHAQEYRLYLPSKEELQRKLAEWANEADND